MSYTWADDQCGMLAEIIGVTRFLALIGFNYVVPIVPPLTHAGITG